MAESIKLNDNNKIKYNTLFVNKSEDNLYEQGRNGFGYVFDQDPQEDGAFVRDQNFRQTTLFVNQILGTHDWSDTNTLNWAGGYNFVLAEEPNRIRNEVNILGPVISPIKKLRKKYRCRILIKYPKNLFIQKYLSQSLNKIKLNGGIKLEVDVDPINFS